MSIFNHRISRRFKLAAWSGCRSYAFNQKPGGMSTFSGSFILSMNRPADTDFARSDLECGGAPLLLTSIVKLKNVVFRCLADHSYPRNTRNDTRGRNNRSEERRVGKECRSRRWP